MKILIENESFECASGATVYDALKEAGKIYRLPKNGGSFHGS